MEGAPVPNADGETIAAGQIRRGVVVPSPSCRVTLLRVGDVAVTSVDGARTLLQTASAASELSEVELAGGQRSYAVVVSSATDDGGVAVLMSFGLERAFVKRCNPDPGPTRWQEVASAPPGSVPWLGTHLSLSSGLSQSLRSKPSASRKRRHVDDESGAISEAEAEADAAASGDDADDARAARVTLTIATQTVSGLAATLRRLADTVG